MQRWRHRHWPVTEHTCFEGERINAVREMFLADDEAGRRKALAKLLAMRRGDFEGLFREMSGLPVTIRLLDPPLNEFVPHDAAGQQVMANEMHVSPGKIKMRVDELQEFNPMMGHRGCRLGIIYPEITAMKALAVFESALNAKAQVVHVRCEIMVPLVGTVREFNAQAAVIRRTAAQAAIDARGQTAARLEPIGAPALWWPQPGRLDAWPVQCFTVCRTSNRVFAALASFQIISIPTGIAVDCA